MFGMTALEINCDVTVLCIRLYWHSECCPFLFKSQGSVDQFHMWEDLTLAVTY